MRITERISGIEGVAASSSATIRLPINRRYHWLKLFVTANTTAAGNAAITDIALIIDSIQLYVSGRLVRDVTPAFIVALAKMNGITLPDLVAAIYFSEPWRASVMDEQATAWDVFGESDLVLKVKFKSGIQDVSLSGLSCYDAGQATLPDGRVVRNIIKQTPYSWNAAAGQLEITNLPTTLPIQRLLLTGASSTQITAAEVVADSLKVHESKEAENAEILRDYRLDSTAFDYPLVFDPHQQLFDSLSVRRDLVVRLFTASGGLIQGILEQRSGSYV